MHDSCIKYQNKLNHAEKAIKTLEQGRYSPFRLTSLNHADKFELENPAITEESNVNKHSDSQ